ncbi:hypothetical protein [Streptomyces ipomoeae]|uniref:hypothetical protein n=1 Tax=Streptomyces ipomoeae TaxID=103232 RepID=UPI0029A7B8FD|nr:hypothetical protein [Streptomyces ipomoeae]MDX2696851.1 hypothetical protein [Streptomyces ipomoeae]MDX2843159.1 hypothetical protein [Streptomyces ipomoeae]
MPDFIPAAPGWYVSEHIDGETDLDPVIAWKPATTSSGEDTLLPVVNGGVCVPPIVLDEASFQQHGRHVVYRPSHDPAKETS